MQSLPHLTLHHPFPNVPKLTPPNSPNSFMKFLSWHHLTARLKKSQQLNHLTHLWHSKAPTYLTYFLLRQFDGIFVHCVTGMARVLCVTWFKGTPAYAWSGGFLPNRNFISPMNKSDWHQTRDDTFSNQHLINLIRLSQ